MAPIASRVRQGGLVLVREGDGGQISQARDEQIKEITDKRGGVE